MDEERRERLAKNESLFRSLNENIHDLAAKLAPGETYDFICECSARGCFEPVRLTLAEYESVRGDGAHFLIAEGHEEPEIEHVVAERETHVVVEKEGIAGEVAREDDPTRMSRLAQRMFRREAYQGSVYDTAEFRGDQTAGNARDLDRGIFSAKSTFEAATVADEAELIKNSV